MAKGKLKNLFKKKEGGTFIGNLLRKAGDTFTGGAYSSLFPKPTAQDVANNTPIINKNADVSLDYDGATQKASVVVSDGSENTPFYKKPVALIGGAVAVLGVIIAIIFKRKK